MPRRVKKAQKLKRNRQTWTPPNKRRERMKKVLNILKQRKNIKMKRQMNKQMKKRKNRNETIAKLW